MDRQTKNIAETPRPFEDRRVLEVAAETLRDTRDALASVIESAPVGDAKFHIKDAFGDVVLAIRCLERALSADHAEKAARLARIKPPVR